MLSLPLNQVHLWLVFEDEVQAALLPEYRRLLTDDERQQERRFHFAKDQRRFLITRALVRTVLARYSNHRPEYWRFVRNAHGRPILLNGDAFMRAVSFNVSHTDGLVMCGVSHAHAIGVDVENIRREIPFLEIADRTFSRQEAAALRALPAHAQPERFFHYWTIKESYVKARGKGLSIPLEQLRVDFINAHSMQVSSCPSLENDPADSRFWLLQPSSEFVSAVCVEQPENSHQHLVMKKSIPLDMETLFDCPVLRQSIPRIV